MTTTAKTVEFFFDVGSPAAYLAATQLPALCARAGATLVWRPMLLGGVFQATGNASPALVPAKRAWLDADYGRFAQRYGVPLVINPHFPINTLMLMRAITGLQLRQPQRLDALLQAVWQALWVDGRNLNDAATTAAMLQAAGFDPAQVQALCQDDAVKAALRAGTDEAVARGVFGAPTCFAGGQMFFGQDRLDFIAAALA